MTMVAKRRDSRTSKPRSNSRKLFWERAQREPEWVKRAATLRNRRDKPLKKAAAYCKCSEKTFVEFVTQYDVCRGNPDGEEVFLRGSEKEITLLGMSLPAALIETALDQIRPDIEAVAVKVIDSAAELAVLEIDALAEKLVALARQNVEALRRGKVDLSTAGRLIQIKLAAHLASKFTSGPVG
jgi:hypothetical protein